MTRSRSALRTSLPEQCRRRVRRLATTYEWDRITPHDVAALLTDDWSGAGPLHIDASVSLAELEAAGAVMLANARAILRATRQAGVAPEVPVLEQGTRMEVERLFRQAGYADTVRAGFNNRILGPQIDPLHWTQVLLEVAGLLERSPAGFVLTAEGDGLLEAARAGELYAHLFRAFFRTFNLAYLDRLPELAELQDLVPHWLWVFTGPLGAGFTSASLYVGMEIPRDLSDKLERRAVPARLRHLGQTRVLDPLADFGLLEPEPGDDESAGLGDVGFRPTNLFRRVLRIDIPYPEGRHGRGHLRLLR